MEVATFLPNCTEELPNAKQIQAKLISGSNDGSEQDEKDSSVTTDETKNFVEENQESDFSERVLAEFSEYSDECDDDSDDRENSEGNILIRKRPNRTASKLARKAVRAFFANLETSTKARGDEIDDDDDEEFQERTYDTEGSAAGEEDVFSDSENSDDNDSSSEHKMANE